MGLFSRDSGPSPAVAGLAFGFTALRVATASLDDDFDGVRHYAGGEPIPLSRIDESEGVVSPGFDAVLNDLVFAKPAVAEEDAADGIDVSIHDDFDRIVDALSSGVAEERDRWDGEAVVAVPGRYVDAAAERLGRRVAGPEIDPIGLVRTDVASAVARGVEHANGASRPGPHPVVVAEVGLFDTTTAVVEVNSAEDRVRVHDRVTVDGGSQLIDNILAKGAVTDALDVDEDDVPFELWAQVLPTVREVRDDLGRRPTDRTATVRVGDDRVEIPVSADAVRKEVDEFANQTAHNVEMVIDRSGYRLGEIGAVCLTGLGVRTPAGGTYVEGIRSRLTDDLSGSWVTDHLKTGTRYAPERGAALIAQRELNDSTDAFDVYDDT